MRGFEVLHILLPTAERIQFLFPSATRQDDRRCLAKCVFFFPSSCRSSKPLLIVGFPAWSLEEKRNMSALALSIFPPNKSLQIYLYRAIYIAGIMFYKLGLEFFNGSITTLATDRFSTAHTFTKCTYGGVGVTSTI